jgi:pimeloyl-ACP methyl ester carboxylesterase
MDARLNRDFRTLRELSKSAGKVRLVNPISVSRKASRSKVTSQRRSQKPAVAACILMLAASACSSSKTQTRSEAATTTTSAATSVTTSTVPSSTATVAASTVTSAASSTTTAVPTTAPAKAPKPKPCGPVDYKFPTDEYPFTDRCIDLGYGDYHYFDESPEGTPKGVALMVHGNPASSFLYRNVAKNLLKRGYRVVAMDHYGFGESAHPTVAQFGYKPSDHSRVLIDFVDALQIQNATLVVQDWGGPIGLSMAVKRPDRIKNIVVLNTWAWQVTDADESGLYGPLTRWSQLNKTAGEKLLDTGITVTGAAGGLAATYEEPTATKVKNAYLGPFFDPVTGKLRSSTIAIPTNIFARSIIDDKATFTTLGALEPIVNKPVYFYFGGQDPVFGALVPNADGTCADGVSTERDGLVFCANEAGGRIYPYVDHFKSLWNPDMVKGAEINETSSHFVQEKAPDRVSDIVISLNP